MTTLQALFDESNRKRLFLEDIMVQVAEAVRPPERLTVSEAAAKYRKLNNPGAYTGPWLNETTPYLVEVMDVLASTDYEGMVFAGPAQCGKTDIFLNWQTYSVLCDPADMMLIQTSQTTARDFSLRRIDRLHRSTRAVKEKMIQRRDADNTFDKQYANGMLLTLSWPTINELSGKPIPRLWLTDYDRMDQDVDGEGSPFDLAKKRATTFRSYGMCAAESSPGFIVDNPKWVRSSKHQAPPTQGILALYNRGDRRRWYWQCVECKNTFEPDFNLLHYPDSEDFVEAAEMASLRCPFCEIDYHHDPMGGMPGKHEMNRQGRWIKDGQIWLPSGEIQGVGARSEIASFWLKGVAASFASWKTLVFNYLTAEAEYENTGTEEALKTTVNTDQGNPYTLRSEAGERSPEDIKARAKEIGEREIPPGVRFLIAAIDVQKNRFIVQVHGVNVGRDVTIIDRFEIRKSKRLDEDGEHRYVNPGAYLEDWKILVSEVLAKSYPLMDGSGRRMGIKLTVCDSGGRAGVTEKAYDFYRWLKKTPEEYDEDDKSAELEEGEYEWLPGMAERFQLIKGDPNPKAPRVLLRYPDSQRKDRHAGARGEIPVLFLNSNALKDQVDKMLDRTEPGGGRINFPKWLDDNFFIELTVEVKTHKGWENPKNYRNESWDLLYYYVGATLSTKIRLETLEWKDPPSWAEEWDLNDLVFDPETDTMPMQPKTRKRGSLAKLASNLA
jgi:phage terminase large subunit GpA-like protein